MVHLLKIAFYSLAIGLNISQINGSIFDFLKPALEKGANHKMRNIDFIYMINLDQRPEKFLATQSALRRYGIHPYRFSAVNGWELSKEAFQNVGLKLKEGMTPLLSTTYYSVDGKMIQSHEYMDDPSKSYFCHCMAPGPIGCALSHISILKDAFESNYEVIWVLEDDIEIIRNPHILSDYIDKMNLTFGKNGWDILFTDYDGRKNEVEYNVCEAPAKRPDMDCSSNFRRGHFSKKKKINKYFRELLARYGTYSMIISRSGIKKMLDFFVDHKIYLPIDMDNSYVPTIKRYGVMENIVSHKLDALSDNGAPFYKK